ncbi:MAG: 30S ribosomal protein S6 [Candidatus Aminicenantes bacterium]|jgi:small subunit ribosomal protein S6
MRQYETAFLIAPNLPEEDNEKLISQMADVISKKKGIMVNVDEWGKRKLAYPIQKYEEAYYVFFLYEGDPSIPEELERRFKQTEAIIRYLTVKNEISEPKKRGRVPAKKKREAAEEEEKKGYKKKEEKAASTKDHEEEPAEKLPKGSEKAQDKDAKGKKDSALKDPAKETPKKDSEAELKEQPEIEVKTEPKKGSEEKAEEDAKTGSKEESQDIAKENSEEKLPTEDDKTKET